MKSGPWNVRSGEIDIREAAATAARRAGLTLGAWLDDAIADRAALLRVSADELSESERVDAVAARLGALPLDETRPSTRARIALDRPPPLRLARTDARLLDAAAARLGLRPESDDAQDVARRIADLEHALGRRDARRAPPPLDPPLDHRMRRMAASLLGGEPAGGEEIRVPPRREPTSAGRADIEGLRDQINDLSRAVAILAERAGNQGLEPALRDLVARIEASRAEGVDEAALAPVLRMLVDLRGALEQSPAAVARTLRDEIEDLRVRMADAHIFGREGVEALRRQVETLARALADLIGRMGSQDAVHRQIALLGEKLDALAAAPRAIEARLESLAEDLRHSIQHLDESPAFQKLEGRIESFAGARSDAEPVMAAIADLRDVVDRLGEHPAITALQDEISGLAQASRATPAPLLRTVDGLRQAVERIAAHPSLAPDAAARPAPPSPALVEGLAEIRLSVERLAAGAGPRVAEDQSRLQAIEDRLGALARKLDAPLAINLEPLRAAIVERIDRLGTDLPAGQVAALRASLDETRRLLAQPQAPQVALERLAHQLAAKIDALAGAGAHEPRALQSLENQVLRIAERLDRQGEAGAAIGALERCLGEIAVQIEETRGVAAQTAAAAVADTIARDLSGLRNVQDETERRVRGALDALHETLEKVVDRLAMLEGDIGAMRRPASPEAAPAHAPLVDAPPLSAAAPIAPRIEVRQDMALGLAEPRAAQKSFIAAARRAAHATSAPPLSGEKPGERAPAAAAAADAAARSGEAARKVMLGVAGVVLTLGAAQIARTQYADLTAGDLQTQAAADGAPAASETAPAAAAPQTAEAAPTDPTPVGAIARKDADFDALRDAAVTGAASAQFEVGVRFVEGRGVARDAVAGAYWLDKAARQGHAPAQYRLGALYEKGVGVERSAKEAAKWYGMAAQAGHVRAMHNLGVLLADGLDGKPDYAGAATLFRSAAERGLRDSQYNLAVLYMRGLGVDADMVQAYKWFALAGAQGDNDALAKRDEVVTRLQPRQLTEARKAAESFSLLTPDPTANEAQASSAPRAPEPATPVDPVIQRPDRVSQQQ